jgi:hypothetical protein
MSGIKKKSVQAKLTRLHNPNFNRDNTFTDWSDLACEYRSQAIRNRYFANCLRPQIIQPCLLVNVTSGVANQRPSFNFNSYTCQKTCTVITGNFAGTMDSNPFEINTSARNRQIWQNWSLLRNCILIILNF